MKNKTNKAPALCCEAMVRWIEWITVIFCAIASVGATGHYWLAIDFVLFGTWLHLKNKLLAKQQRTLAINKQFWDSADSDNDPELVETMRELHAALSSPNTVVSECPAADAKPPRTRSGHSL